MGVKEFQYLPDKWDWDSIVGKNYKNKFLLYNLNFYEPLFSYLVYNQNYLQIYWVSQIYRKYVLHLLKYTANLYYADAVHIDTETV